MKSVVVKALRQFASLAALLLAACGGDSPVDVAKQFAEYVIAGDAVSAEGLLTDEERPIVDSLRRTKNDGLLATEPSLTVTIDSARVGRIADDTAYVAVFYTAPNLEGISDSVLKVSASDIEYLKARPRRVDYDTVRVVKDGGRWRVTVDARFRAGFQPLSAAFNSFDSTVAAKARVAQKISDYYASFHRTPTEYVANEIREAREAAAYQDSLDITGSVVLSEWYRFNARAGTHQIKGVVRNRGSRAISHMMLLATLNGGETKWVDAFDVPARGSKDFFKLRLNSYSLVSFDILSIEFEGR